jgi:hypothetical protein
MCQHTPTTTSTSTSDPTANTATPKSSTKPGKSRRPKNGKTAPAASSTPPSAAAQQPKQPLGATIVSVSALFDMHDAITKQQQPRKRAQTANGKAQPRTPNLHLVKSQPNIMSPVSSRIQPTPLRHTVSYTTPTRQTQHQRQQSSSPTAFATPAYADSPNPDEVPLPPTMWMEGTPTRMTGMTGNQIMRQLTIGLAN